MICFPMRQTLQIAALVLLAACSTFSKASAPLDAYTLTPLPVTTGHRSSGRHVVVELPTSSGAVATDRLLIMPNALQAEYLPKARWVDQAPVLIQTLLVTSLQNSGAFRLVGRDGAGLTPDYVLLVEVTAFQAEAPTPDRPETLVRVGLSITMVREEDGSLIATRRFDQTALAPSAQPLDLVAAFDSATRQVLTEAVAWSVKVAN